MDRKRLENSYTAVPTPGNQSEVATVLIELCKEYKQKFPILDEVLVENNAFTNTASFEVAVQNLGMYKTYLREA